MIRRKEITELVQEIVQLKKQLGDVKESLSTLEFQVSCGNKGHEFQLSHSWMAPFPDKKGFHIATILGDFKCFCCGARVIRPLTEEELVSAPILGHSGNINMGIILD